MKKLLLPALVFLASAIYFGLQACPTFYWWDSAELTAAVLGGGVPHPPGFPLLLILARIWISVIPPVDGGSLNLFSSFFAALGVSVWFAVIVRILKESKAHTNQTAIHLLSMISALVMGISLTYSIQATRFEVYSLNFACFAILVIIACKIVSDDHTSHRLYYAFFALMGLAMGAHILTVALAIPGILLILYLYKRINIGRIIPGLVLAALVTIPLYFTIYYLAQNHAPLNWGDPSGMKSLYNYIFLQEFTTSASSFSPGHIIENMSFVVGLLVDQFGFPGLAISVWGLIHLVREKPTMALPLAVILLLNSLSTIYAEEYFIENYDLQGYLMISSSIVALLVAAGLLRMYMSIAAFLKRSESNYPRNLALISSLVIAMLVFAYPVKRNILSADLSNVKGAREYAEQFTDDAPENAIMITSYYNTYFCLLAYNSVDSARDKHRIVNIYNWDHEWGKEEINRRFQRKIAVNLDRQTFYRHFLNEFIKESPIYVEYDMASAPIARYLKPTGLGYLFTATDTSMIDIEAIMGEIEVKLKAVSELENIESLKTWILWFQNRGLYYKHRGYSEAAKTYFSAVDSVAALVRMN
jgi:hypothetical protein